MRSNSLNRMVWLAMARMRCSPDQEHSPSLCSASMLVRERPETEKQAKVDDVSLHC